MEGRPQLPQVSVVIMEDRPQLPELSAEVMDDRSREVAMQGGALAYFDESFKLAMMAARDDFVTSMQIL